MRRHFIIPDAQVQPGSPTDHLEWIGRAVVEYQPDVLVCLGDFADMHSLSSYKTAIEGEGTRYWSDIVAAQEAMKILLDPVRKRWGRNIDRAGAPRMVMLLGNHEYRIQRAVDSQPVFDKMIGMNNLPYEDWEVFDFLEQVTIDGVTYSHYFQQPGTSRAVAGMIETRVKNIGYPFVQGHQQGLKTGMISRNNGELIRGIVAGSCYLHDEGYMGQTNAGHWRGCLVLNDVHHGQFDTMELSMDYLCRRWGTGDHVWKLLKKKYPKIYRNSSWAKSEEVLRGGGPGPRETPRRRT